MNKVADGDFTTQIETESKQFMNSFIEKIEVYPRELPNGRFLKNVHFKFPIFYEGEEIIGLRWDKEVTHETVARLVKNN